MVKKPVVPPVEVLPPLINTGMPRNEFEKMMSLTEEALSLGFSAKQVQTLGPENAAHQARERAGLLPR